MNEEIQVRLAALVERVLGQDLPVALASRFAMDIVSTLIQLVVIPIIIWVIWKYIRNVWAVMRIYDSAYRVNKALSRAESDEVGEKTKHSLIKIRQLAHDIDSADSIGVSGFVCSIIAGLVGVLLTFYWFNLLTNVSHFFFFDGWVLEYLRKFIR